MVEVVNVARDQEGNVKRVDILVDYYLEFSFIKRNKKITEISSSGEIPNVARRIMWGKVCAIFNTTKKNIKSTHKIDSNKQISFNF